MGLLIAYASISAIIRQHNSRDHWEVAPVEGYEIGAVLFGVCSDQSVSLSGAGDQPILPLSNATEAFFLVLLDGWDTQILADLIGQDVTDFGMARYGGPRRFCAGLCHQE